MKDKLRLLLFKECNRNCEGCCNKDWDLDNLEYCESFAGYKEIILTGGEVMLHPEIIIATIFCVREESKAPIYVYTAKVDDLKEARKICIASDGMCITLHEQKDVIPFLAFAKTIGNANRSMKVNIFKGVEIDLSLIPKSWMIKKDIAWIKDCPLPNDEVFMQLKNPC